MKKILLSVFLTAMMFIAFSQQDPQFSQNMFNRLFPNPAVAGSNNAICATLLGRQQWTGFEGRPKTYLLGVNAPISAFLPAAPPIGVGLSVSQDALGQESTFGLKLALSYYMPIGPGKISIGVAAGMQNKTLGSNWVSIDPVDQDAYIPDNGASDMIVDFDFGLYYKIPDKLYLGLSTTHLNGATFEELTDQPPPKVNDIFKYTAARHYYVMAGYSKEINPTFTIQPSVFIKSDAVSTQMDINGILLWNNKFWGGLTYRLSDAIVPLIGVKFDNLGPGTLKFGYSYDVTTSELRRYSNGSHELMLNYCFKPPEKSKEQKHKTVRFL